MAFRVILFTGKGGVGKTSAAAATAVRCSENGLKTLVMSTDAAHSLSDSFDQNIGYAPTQVATHLYAQEIDVNQEIRKNWGPINDFLQSFLQYQGFKNVVAEELAVLPGMEEIFSLLELHAHVIERQFDVVVIDCAPTADTARLLAFPDIARWYMEKIFNIERLIMKAVRPVAKHLVDVPLPQDEFYASLEKLYEKMRAIKELLVDREVTSIRMVVNAEKMVIKEAQRAYTFLSLFDFSIDGVIVNRLLPDSVTDVYYARWKQLQQEHLILIHECFQPLPIFFSRLWENEVTGISMLSRMGREIYQDRNPADIFYKDRPMVIEEKDGQRLMRISLPFAEKKELETWIRGDELSISYKNFKRNIILPRSFVGLELAKAAFIDQTLELTFQKPD
ncbi:MAG: ArsA family ATPase [Deltaproteobacteria bacterium]|nr:ArsA family ATPase [Deltaproteobacteria bacterium]